MNRKNTYKLIALDMDGTLLNSRKEISQTTLNMINRAFDEGKEVVLSTGRCIAELRSTFEQIPRLHYAICVSGSLLYDVQKQEVIASHPISADLCSQIIEAGKDQDPMFHFLGIESIVQEDRLDRLADYQMGIYTDMFRKVTSPVPDMIAYHESNYKPMNKLNMYFTNEESRAKVLTRLQEKKLPLEIVFAEATSLECSAKGVTKGNGLMDLCKYLGIDIEETIAVGDADNDLAILSMTGLPIAMGNANENVKNICKVVVADCDHDGCAEAIEKYLL